MVPCAVAMGPLTPPLPRTLAPSLAHPLAHSHTQIHPFLALSRTPSLTEPTRQLRPSVRPLRPSVARSLTHSLLPRWRQTATAAPFSFPSPLPLPLSCLLRRPDFGSMFGNGDFHIALCVFVPCPGYRQGLQREDRKDVRAPSQPDQEHPPLRRPTRTRGGHPLCTHLKLF